MMLAYLLQSSLCWLVFYGFYWLFLRKQTFFHYNRAYLLLSLMAGLLMPMLGQYLQVNHAGDPIIAELPVVYIGWIEPVMTVESTSTQAAGGSPQQWWLLIYLLGAGLFLLRLLKGFYQLWRLSRRAETFVHAGYRLFTSASIVSPFSFFRLIFWNPAIRLQSEEGKAIFAHERAHIRLGHSFDLLLVEVLRVIFWFNPIFHFYKKSLRNVHEYQADAAVLQRVPVRPYGQMLLYQARYNSANLLPMGNYFFTKQIKARIMMMTKQPSSRRKLWLYIAALPGLLILGMLTFQTEATAETPGTKDGQAVAVEMKLPIKFKLDESDQKVALQEVDQLPVFPGCDTDLEGEELRQCSNTKMIQFVGEHLVYPKAAAENGIEGMVVVSFVIEKDGSVSEVKGLKGIGGGCEEEVMRVVYSMPNWQPGTKDGQSVRTELKLPVKFVAAQAEAMNQKKIQYDLKLSDYRLSPNPARDQVEINFKGEDGDLQVRIFDTNGKVIFQEASNQFAGFYSKQIDLSGAAQGMYFVQIRQHGKAFIDRFSVVE
jgi:TonB family protein